MTALLCLLFQGVLALLEAQKIFNGVVVTQVITRDESSLSVEQMAQQKAQKAKKKKQDAEELEGSDSTASQVIMAK